jgi:multimeric flavodoxin WrbA
MKRLLIVWHSQTGHTKTLADSVMRGATRCTDVKVICRHAPDCGVDELLAADGLLIGTPENFGTMSGLIKDFFDRTYYPVEGKMLGRPYAVFVSAGNDGSGAHREIDRIALGYGWKKVHDGHIAKIEVSAADIAACEELGELMATALALGVF